jgi:hypothetical protein
LVEQQVRLVLLAHQVQPLDLLDQLVLLELETLDRQVRLEVLEEQDQQAQRDLLGLEILVRRVQQELRERLDLLDLLVQLAHKVFQ